MSHRQKLIECFEQDKPFFDSGRIVEFKVLVDQDNKSFSIRSGELEMSMANGDPIMIPNSSDILDMIRQTVRSTLNKEADFRSSDKPDYPYDEDDQKALAENPHEYRHGARSFRRYVTFIKAEIHCY